MGCKSAIIVRKQAPGSAGIEEEARRGTDVKRVVVALLTLNLLEFYCPSSQNNIRFCRCDQETQLQSQGGRAMSNIGACGAVCVVIGTVPSLAFLVLLPGIPVGGGSNIVLKI